MLIKSVEELIKFRKDFADTNKGELVVTNGCFDIIHVGHVRYLEQAKKLGSALLVGVNSDFSVRELKGKTRPVNPELCRAEVLNALKSVDFTFIFDGKTASEFLALCKPNIYVKGGDYSIEELPEREILKEINCKVHFLPFHEGFSTTRILNGDNIS